MDKCNKCLNGRLIISENGYHYICMLSQKAASKCLFGTKNRFVGLKEYKETKECDCDISGLTDNYKCEEELSFGLKGR